MLTKKLQNNLRILITGATGYVGYFLYDHFTKMGVEVYGISSSVSDDKLKMFRADITDRQAIQKIVDIVQPSIVIHCAALADIDYCEQNPEIAYAVNVGGTQNIIESVKRYNAPFVLLSTEAIYDGKADLAYSEQDVSVPVNVYGRSKLEAEIVVKHSGLTYLVARCARVLGASHKNTGRQFDKILDKVKGNETIQIDAERKFTPTWNLHLAKVIEWWIVDYHKKLVCNVAVPDSTIFYDLLRVCAVQSKKKIKITKKPMVAYSAPRPKYTRLNSDLLHSLGAPTCSLEELEKALIEDLDAA